MIHDKQKEKMDKESPQQTILRNYKEMIKDFLSIHGENFPINQFMYYLLRIIYEGIYELSPSRKFAEKFFKGTLEDVQEDFKIKKMNNWEMEDVLDEDCLEDVLDKCLEEK